MNAAAQAGTSRMFLETESHDQRARGCYTRLGFATEDSVWMSRELTASASRRADGGHR